MEKETSSSSRSCKRARTGNFFSFYAVRGSFFLRNIKVENGYTIFTTKKGEINSRP